MTGNTLAGNASADSAQVRSAAVFRNLLLKRFEAIKTGSLAISDGGQVHSFGSGEPAVHVQVHSASFYRRVALGGAVAAGDAYMDRQWDCDDLVALIRLLVLNRDVLTRLDGASSLTTRFGNLLQHFARRNSPAGSRRNIKAHYDLSNEFFATFLDEQMMYSSAVYESPSASLEQASTAKLERLCRKLELSPDDHLLEIGTGWGGLAVHAARHCGCRVTTTTISAAQYAAARDKVREAGLEDRVTVLCKDYRELEGRFDKLVSVEMVEAVGHQYLDEYFTTCSRLVKPGGLIVLQAITIDDGRYEQALRNVDFIKKHIFPGGFMPCVSRLVSAAARSTDTVLVNLEDIGADYARTLRAWRQRFEARREDVRALGFDTGFRRMWRFYLAYCEGAFLERATSAVQLVFAKPGYRGQPWRATL